MKNKITDLRNHMFAALERLNSEDLTPEQLQQEISRAQAVSEVGKVIVDSAKTEVMYMKVAGKSKDVTATGFLDEGDTKGHLERAPAEYSNHSPMRIANTGM